MRRSKHSRGMAIWLLAMSQVTMLAGCRQDGGRSGPGSSSRSSASVAPGATAGPNLGEILYGVLSSQFKNAKQDAEYNALAKNKTAFVDAVNRTLPTDVSKGLWPMVEKILPLVDDDTVGNGLKDVEGMMRDMVADQTVVQAMADLMGSHQPVPMPFEPRDMVRLVGRLLSHPQFEDLAKATNDLIKTNPDQLKTILALASRHLKAVTPQTFQGSSLNLQGLAGALLTEVDTTGLGDLGSPAWAVRLDAQGNPKVMVDPATRKVLPPFVDNGKGEPVVNANGERIDASGAAITLKPFGRDGKRDSDGRAIAAGGLTIFEYFDAKKTLLGTTLVLVGQLFKKHVPTDLTIVLDKSVPRVLHVEQNGEQWMGFGPDNALADLLTSNLELVRRTPLPQLLEGLALVVKKDPAKFEQLVTDLVSAINLAISSGFSGAGSQKMLDDLLPLLSEASKPRGNNVSAVRALLRSFNGAQAQLQNLPQGFARMMKFNDYGKKIPTGPGLPSAMERLLGIMERSNNCNAPFLGNIAELYLDTMAGNNKAILGIKLDIKTMNSLVKISFLRNLLCSQLNADDCNVLQDFADTGTLDAFIPIAKAFSDQGETKLLVQIMLGLGKHYATAMRANEPATCKLLESGAVEKLFKAIDQMTQVTVPSNGQKLIDVLADTAGALLDDSKPLVDRRGRTYKTLVHLMKAPLDDLAAQAKAAGVTAECDRALSNVVSTALATYKDATGKDRLVYGGLVRTLGDTLEFASQQIPADPVQRSSWVDSQQKTIKDLLQSRDVAALVELMITVKSSQHYQIFSDAVAGLFTPEKNAQYDALGSILQLVASLVQKPASGPVSPSSAQAIATVLNFVGAEIDPKAGKMDRLITMVQKFVAADDGLLILKIARNAVDMGVSGNDEPAVLVLVKIFGEIRAAGGSSGALTAQSITDGMNKAINFMNDQKAGLPHFIDMIKHRSK